MRTVVSEALWLVSAGSVVGLAEAVFLSPLLRSMLVGVSIHDAISLCMAWPVITAVGIIASYVPAARASRINPNALLRSE